MELIDLVNSFNFSISNGVSQIFIIPTWIPDCYFHSPPLLDLFFSCDVIICYTMAFLPLWISDHAVFLVSIDFLSNSKGDAPFHSIAYDYSHDDWDNLCDHLRDGPWEAIFKLGASAAAVEFFEWVQVGIDVYVRHLQYQISIIYMVVICFCCIQGS